MPIVATLYHNDDGTVPTFVAPTPHEVRHYFIKPMALGCNGDILLARDGTLPGEVTTTGAEGSISVALASAARTGGIDLWEAAPLGSMVPMNSLAQVQPTGVDS